MARRSSIPSLVGALLATLLLVAGCGSPDAGDQPAAPDTDGDTATLLPDDGGTGGATGGGEDGKDGEEGDMPSDGDPEVLAIQDAADRAGVDRADIEVVTNEAVTWSDGSLGCPEEGQFYTQALVEGYRIVVEAGTETFEYHGADGQPPAYCADPQPPVQGPGTVDQ